MFLIPSHGPGTMRCTALSHGVVLRSDVPPHASFYSRLSLVSSNLVKRSLFYTLILLREMRSALLEQQTFMCSAHVTNSDLWEKSLDICVILVFFFISYLFDSVCLSGGLC